MAKRREFLTIGNHEFLVHHKSVNDFVIYNHLRDIYDCYVRPSNIKVSIYHDWEDFFRSENRDVITYCYNSGVASYNCMMFTYGACCDIIYNDEFRRATFIITKTREEVFIFDF